jgi:hypothetical protein
MSRRRPRLVKNVETKYIPQGDSNLLNALLDPSFDPLYNSSEAAAWFNFMLEHRPKVLQVMLACLDKEDRCKAMSGACEWGPRRGGGGSSSYCKIKPSYSKQWYDDWKSSVTVPPGKIRSYENVIFGHEGEYKR